MNACLPQKLYLFNQDEYKNKHESYDCGVCYKTLTMDDNVVTKCSHHYCKDCFYRWIQTNASCPMCRTPITSNAHLTEEQLQMALSESSTSVGKSSSDSSES